MDEYIFTFGDGPNAGKCVRIQGDYETARLKMFSLVGNNWGFQYSVDDWEQFKQDPELKDKLEKEIDISEFVI